MVYGVTFRQGRNNFKIDASLLTNLVTENKELPESAKIDLIVALITLKYTQSNSVCFAYDGQAIGVGAGQQSRIHCTRLAGSKADTCIWQNYFTERPEPLTVEDKRAFLGAIRGVSLGSDAFFPFADNIKRAYASGVSYIAQPGGSIRDDLVIEECNKDGIVMAFTGMRLFHH